MTADVTCGSYKSCPTENICIYFVEPLFEISDENKTPEKKPESGHKRTATESSCHFSVNGWDICCILVFYKTRFWRSQTEDNCVLTMSFRTLSTAICKAIRHKPQQWFKMNKMTILWSWPMASFGPRGANIYSWFLCVYVSVYVCENVSNMFNSVYILRLFFGYFFFSSHWWRDGEVFPAEWLGVI